MKQMRTLFLSAWFIFAVIAVLISAIAVSAAVLAQSTNGTAADADPAQHSQPAAAHAVDLTASDGTLLKASYFPAVKPGPGVLLLPQINRTRNAWDGLASQLAAAGINTLTLDMRGFGESGGTPYTKLTGTERAKERKMWPGEIDTAFEYLISQPGVERNTIGVGGAGQLGVENSIRAARRHLGGVRSLVFLSGQTDPSDRQFMRQASLPALFVLAEGDEYPPDRKSVV
jgi:pimeloyl-ACP methyl ester carboxylesterase